MPCAFGECFQHPSLACCAFGACLSFHQHTSMYILLQQSSFHEHVDATHCKRASILNCAVVNGAHTSLNAATTVSVCITASRQLTTIQSGIVAPGQEGPVRGSGSPLSRTTTRTSSDQPDSSLPPLHKQSYHGSCSHTPLNSFTSAQLPVMSGHCACLTCNALCLCG